MSALSEVMLWAMRVNGKRDAAPHVVLDIKADASLDDAQAAFHKIARIAHPDLHRTTLTPEDLETVTVAYARAAAAYQDFRAGRVRQSAPAGSGSTTAPAMSSKALIYYRKAELCLRRGELRVALLQLKMAIAADPQSSFLRTALAEVEAEVAKAPT